MFKTKIFFSKFRVLSFWISVGWCLKTFSWKWYTQKISVCIIEMNSMPLTETEMNSSRYFNVMWPFFILDLKIHKNQDFSKKLWNYHENIKKSREHSINHDKIRNIKNIKAGGHLSYGWISVTQILQTVKTAVILLTFSLWFLLLMIYVLSLNGCTTSLFG